MKLRVGAAVALLLASLTMLAACAPSGDTAPDPVRSDPPAASGTPSASPDDEPSPTPTPTPTPTATPIAMPDDCRAILSGDVLAQLKDVPLNSPTFGESGVLGDGSLLCIWGDPRADTTRLLTKIERMPRGEALDMLNALADDEGFTCYTPDGGTRCEKTWENEQYPVTDGRTLFWRQDILIDTRYSNMAPEGYTSSIVAALWG